MVSATSSGPGRAVANVRRRSRRPRAGARIGRCARRRLAARAAYGRARDVLTDRTTGATGLATVRSRTGVAFSRTGERTRVLYWIVKGTLTPVLRAGYRIQVEGEDHVPRDGAAILAANHRSFLDSIFLPLVVHAPRDVRRQGRVLRRPEDGVVLPGRRPDPDPPRRRERERAGARLGDRRAARRRCLRHLPRGHTHTRRLPAPRPHRRGPARACAPARRSSRSG